MEGSRSVLAGAITGASSIAPSDYAAQQHHLHAIPTTQASLLSTEISPLRSVAARTAVGTITADLQSGSDPRGEHASLASLFGHSGESGDGGEDAAPSADGGASSTSSLSRYPSLKRQRSVLAETVYGRDGFGGRRGALGGRDSTGSASGYTGVHAHHKTWRVVVSGTGLFNMYLGTFDSPEPAALAADLARIALLGQEASAPNFHGAKLNLIGHAEVLAALAAAPADTRGLSTAELEARAKAAIVHLLRAPRDSTGSASGYSGVRQDGGMWRVSVSGAGLHHLHLGRTEEKEDAALAYDLARVALLGKAANALTLHGAKLNRADNEEVIAALAAAPNTREGTPQEELAEAARAAVSHLLKPKESTGSASGFTGVYQSGTSWRAVVLAAGIKLFLGSADTREAAALAYDLARISLLGREAGKVGKHGGKLNCPDNEQVKRALEKAPAVVDVRSKEKLMAAARHAVSHLLVFNYRGNSGGEAGGGGGKSSKKGSNSASSGRGPSVGADAGIEDSVAMVHTISRAQGTGIDVLSPPSLSGSSKGKTKASAGKILVGVRQVGAGITDGTGKGGTKNRKAKPVSLDSHAGIDMTDGGSLHTVGLWGGGGKRPRYGEGVGTYSLSSHPAGVGSFLPAQSVHGSFGHISGARGQGEDGVGGEEEEGDGEFYDTYEEDRVRVLSEGARGTPIYGDGTMYRSRGQSSVAILHGVPIVGQSSYMPPMHGTGAHMGMSRMMPAPGHGSSYPPHPAYHSPSRQPRSMCVLAGSDAHPHLGTGPVRVPLGSSQMYGSLPTHLSRPFMYSPHSGHGHPGTMGMGLGQGMMMGGPHRAMAQQHGSSPYEYAQGASMSMPVPTHGQAGAYSGYQDVPGAAGQYESGGGGHTRFAMAPYGGTRNMPALQGARGPMRMQAPYMHSGGGAGGAMRTVAGQPRSDASVAGGMAQPHALESMGVPGMGGMERASSTAHASRMPGPRGIGPLSGHVYVLGHRQGPSSTVLGRQEGTGGGALDAAQLLFGMGMPAGDTQAKHRPGGFKPLSL